MKIYRRLSMAKQKTGVKARCGKINCEEYEKSSSQKLLNEGSGGKARKPMLIANPTYDVVFKYLLDDNKIAKKLLSLIIGKEIITLDYKPTEIRNDLDEKADCLNNRSLTLLHIDFSALVKLEDGTEQHIIIELQKATYFADIMRFRRYLGTQYADPENFYMENGNRIVMPIFSIYFLCDYLKHTKVPVIKVDRTYCDAATGEEITEREEFIEGLTHDSIIIQTPALKTHRRNLLEKVLSVFQAGKAGKRMIDFPEEDYPEEYREVIRRLLQAGAEKKIRDTMILEDEIIAELEGMERTIAKKDQLIDEKDQALEEKDQVIEAKDRQLAKAVEALAKSLGISLEEAKKMLS
jgi:hypothetical protein